MSAVLKDIDDKRMQADPMLLQRLCDLFYHQHWGNMGPDLYVNGGAERFENVLTASYTPYAGEKKLLSDNKSKIIQWAEGMETAIIVGPGPGRSVRSKEIPILKSMPNLKRVISIELSPVFNRQSLAALESALTDIEVHAIEMDFRKADLSSIENSKPALVISTGSFTNFEDCPTESFPFAQINGHVGKLAELAGKGGKILWGYDSTLKEDQYNNPLVSDFLNYPLEKASLMESVILDPKGFQHETRANAVSSVLSHDWVATRPQDVHIGRHMFAVDTGDRFPMFVSVKPLPDRVVRSVKGLGIETSFTERDASGAVIQAFDCK